MHTHYLHAFTDVQIVNFIIHILYRLYIHKYTDILCAHMHVCIIIPVHPRHCVVYLLQMVCNPCGKTAPSGTTKVVTQTLLCMYVHM